MNKTVNKTVNENSAIHAIVSPEEWVAARQHLLAREKEFTAQRDLLNAERRRLPWVKVDKPYLFEGPQGRQTLADLFEGRSQLIIYHFMFGPGWKEGCPSCSMLADHLDGILAHIAPRDITVAVVSRAPLAELAAFRQRMGWRFKWLSSYGSDFNHDHHVSFTKEELARGKVYYNYRMTEGGDELPGASVFYKDGQGNIFHTYSTYARGLELLLGVYSFIDLTPQGRDEDGLPFTMAWVRHHDKYEDALKSAAQAASSCCHAEASAL